MSKHFLHIGFNWNETPKIKEIKPIFDKALDWVRYAPNCWLVWTSSTPQVWYERLMPYLGENDHVFICAVDISLRQGWLPKWIWEWIRKERE